MDDLCPIEAERLDSLRTNRNYRLQPIPEDTRSTCFISFDGIETERNALIPFFGSNFAFSFTVAKELRCFTNCAFITRVRIAPTVSSSADAVLMKENDGAEPAVEVAAASDAVCAASFLAAESSGIELCFISEPIPRSSLLLVSAFDFVSSSSSTSIGSIC